MIEYSKINDAYRQAWNEATMYPGPDIDKESFRRGFEKCAETLLPQMLNGACEWLDNNIHLLKDYPDSFSKSGRDWFIGLFRKAVENGL